MLPIEPTLWVRNIPVDGEDTTNIWKIIDRSYTHNLDSWVIKAWINSFLEGIRPRDNFGAVAILAIRVQFNLGNDFSLMSNNQPVIYDQFLLQTQHYVIDNFYVS